MALLSLAVTLNLALTVVPHVTALSLIALFASSVNSGVTLNESLDTSAAVATAVLSVVSSTTGVSVTSSENVSATEASASDVTATSEPSLNSAAHTGTLEVASIATTSDILNVFFAMPFFVFLIFVMIIVPLWVVDRLIFEKISYGELISDLRNVRIL